MVHKEVGKLYLFLKGFDMNTNLLFTDDRLFATPI